MPGRVGHVPRPIALSDSTKAVNDSDSERPTAKPVGVKRHAEIGPHTTIVQGRGEPRIDTSSPGDRSVGPFVPPRVGSGPHAAEVESWVPSHVSTRRMVIQFFYWRQGHFADSVKECVCSMWNRGVTEDRSVAAQRNDRGGCDETPYA